MHKATRRTVLLLLVIALLTLPWAASAAGPQASPRTARALLPEALDLFGHLWSLFRKEGCHIDPDGLCATSAPQGPQTKAGCGIDPSGCPSQNPRTQTKEGCNIDPNGHCLP